jgi:transposase
MKYWTKNEKLCAENTLKMKTSNTSNGPCSKDLKIVLRHKSLNLKGHSEQAWELEEIYQLRNTFNAIFDIAANPKEMKCQLNQWIKHAKKLNHKPMNAFLNTLNNRIKQITAFAQYRVTNAITEGLNNIIRYFKRISFGIPNFNNMRLRILIQSI